MATPSMLIVPDRYKSGVLYSQLPESGAVDFDVTRATTAFRTNASGILESVASGVPRLDYPALGGCPALLVEPAATNLVLRSEEFDDAYWTKGRTTTTANTSVSPDGTTTAETLTDDTTASATHRLFSSNVSVVSGTSYAASCFFKAGTSTRVEIILADSIEAGIGITATVFDLSTGTVISGSGRIENYGNGWFRCTNTGTSNFTGNGRVFIYLYNSANQRTYTGDATNTVFIWGAQIETGSVATSYIPTTSATATRNADVISKTGVSGFIGQTEGTLYAEVDLRNFNTGGSRSPIGISDGTTNNRIVFFITASNTIRALVTEANAAQADIESLASLSTGIVKMALAYAHDDFVLYVNGTQIGTDTSGAVPACSQINIGASVTSSAQLNDRIRAAAIYTTRLSNTELAALTTL
jgi:hypothetical protein